MNLTPGHLYFINEKDIVSGKNTDFYKIGIVRQSDERDSKNRLLEHQTGNPRKLIIVESFSMPAVEAVETNLHYLFARNRVMGEWMKFTKAELAGAIKKAKELKKTVKKQLPNFEIADALKNRVSNGVMLPKDSKTIALHCDASRYQAIESHCNTLISNYKNYLNQAIEKGVDVSAQASTQSRKGSRRFNIKLFSTNYPELFEKYSKKTKYIKQSFLFKNKLDFQDLSEIYDSEQLKLVDEFMTLLKKPKFDLETGFALHEKHLGILEILKYVEWHHEIIITSLKVLLGENEGIEGICTWKRERNEKIELDTEALKVKFPEIYADCVTESKPTEVLIVKPKMAEKK